MIDQDLRRLSDELAEASGRLYGGERVVTQANGLEEEVLVRIRSLRTRLDEAWPSSGDVWSLVGPDRIVTFLQTAPRYVDFRPHYDCYWRALAAHPLDDGLVVRLQTVILDLLEMGFSASLDLAVPVAAAMWNRGLKSAVEAAPVPSDPVRAAARDRFVWLVERRVSATNPDLLPPRPGSAHEVVSSSLRELEASVRAHPSGGQYRFEFAAPATSEAIETLRSEIAPFPLPSSLETWLRFSNGGGWHFWPGNQLGPTTRAHDMIDQRMTASDLRHPPGLLPIGYASHTWLVIELVAHREAAVFELPFGENPRAVAPSLAAYFDATTACIEAGYFERWQRQGPWVDDPLRIEFDAIWLCATARHGWRHAPGAPGVWMNPLDYPAEWWEPVRG